MHRKLVISICFVAALFISICFGGDTLSRGESLTGNQTLTSKNRMFELGFFQPNPTQNRFYLSIRYTGFEEKTVVWTANRETPLHDGARSKLEIADDGNLELYHDGNSHWSTGLTSSSSATSPETMVAVLSDEGNLILRDRRPGILSGSLWQSFDHPTNTWVPGATLAPGRRLVSWKAGDDPAPGLFSGEMSEDGDGGTHTQMVLKLNEAAVYWESGPYRFGQFELAPELSSLIRFENPTSATLDNNYVGIINNDSESDPSWNPVFSMIVMDHRRGHLMQLTSTGTGQLRWNTRFLSEGFGFCGAFGILRLSTSSSSAASSNPCSCLRGFVPLSGSVRDWRCGRRIALECGNNNNKKHGFEEILGVIKLPDGAKLLLADGNGSTTVSSSGKECEVACLQRCNCTAYAFNHTGCFIWEGDLMGTQQEISNKQKLYVKLATSDKGNNKTLEVIIAVVVPAVVLVSCGFLGFFYNRRAKHEEHKEPGEDLLLFDFNSTETDNGKISRTRSNTEFDLPMFSYASVSAATNSFSPQNMLGEGGFGPVYKGTLLNGQEIALKRLSQKSGQGFQEFRNEIILIAKLQHRNLVRLLGCCIDPNESIIIYEYMSNKSLDFFLFGSEEEDALDWKTRIHIVEGIAQGLLYLHEYSRVRIIHRDLKASNILLDDEMSPKISDFGMARIFGGADSEAHTNKIVGTIGYIAPEYAMEGLFSTKSDVYSFGVLVLEIISGRKNTGFYKTDSLNLLGHAWELWISDRGVELVDQKVGSQAASTALRYINVGLLCVQENPNDRPTMSSVVSMLSSEIAALPPPKKPAFSTESLISSTSSVKNIAGEPSYPSINDLTLSVIKPR